MIVGCGYCDGDINLDDGEVMCEDCVGLLDKIVKEQQTLIDDLLFSLAAYQED